MSLQVWRMLQKPLCGNQMNLATLKPHQLHFVRWYPPQYYCFIADRYTHLYRVAAGGDGAEGKGGGGGSYNFGGR